MTSASDRDELADALAARPNVSDRAAEAIRAVPATSSCQKVGASTPTTTARSPSMRVRPSARRTWSPSWRRNSTQAGERVLEIGTGCGYHAAVTAELVGAENVYSVEYVLNLADRARGDARRRGLRRRLGPRGRRPRGVARARALRRRLPDVCGPGVPPTVVEQVHTGVAWSRQSGPAASASSTR